MRQTGHLTVLFILAPSVQTAHLDLRNLRRDGKDEITPSRYYCWNVGDESWASGPGRSLLLSWDILQSLVFYSVLTN